MALRAKSQSMCAEYNLFCLQLAVNLCNFKSLCAEFFHKGYVHVQLCVALSGSVTNF